MSGSQHEKFVLLNEIVSKSTTRARDAISPPTHPIEDLFMAIRPNFNSGSAIEFLTEYQEEDNTSRIANGAGNDYMRVKRMAFRNWSGRRYAILLIEYMNGSRVRFPVVDALTRVGRHLAGTANERGAHTAHVVVRLPSDGEYDNGRYRCVIEVAPQVSRRLIEFLLCRQLRRISLAEGWTYPGTPQVKARSTKVPNVRYTPKITLEAKVGRLLGAGGSVENLAQMIFSKNSERQSTGQATHQIDEEFEADVQLVVKASQGPADPAQKIAFLTKIRSLYERRGYTTRMVYRNLSGRITRGRLHSGLDGAADLLMCTRATIPLASAAEDWDDRIDTAKCRQMFDLLERDELWHRP